MERESSHRAKAGMLELTDALPVAVYTTDADGRITHFNEAAASLWGRRPVLGEDRWCGSWRLFQTDGTPLPHDQCPMALALKEDRPVRGLDAIAMRPDGSHFHFAPYPTPLHDDDGELVGAVNVLVDITDRKAAEDALTAAKMDLERRVQENATYLLQARKMEAVGRISCGMAHDFNNVLQGVGNCLTALEEHIRDEKGRQLLATARRGLERGSWLTRCLLAFVRHQALSPMPTGMAGIIQGMRPVLASSMGGLIDIEIRIADDVWPALVDPTQFELALINLAINARDAMPSGGTFTITAANGPIEAPSPSKVMPDHPENLAPGEYVVVSVTDTGSGMDSATLARACDPFFTTKESGKGSGLGLSMVRDMAIQSGGGMHVSSELGRGTTFTIYLPRALSVPEEEASQPAKAVQGQTGGVVLLVDDDDLVRAGAAAVMEAFGYRVLEAESGTQALRILHGCTTIDAMVTDYAMPGMSGAALVEEAHRLLPGLPVLMMTGYSERPKDVADTTWIQKPFEATELAAQLTALIPG
jgi:PAS domain S-box-containing protein